jgi:hypothetical protein
MTVARDTRIRTHKARGAAFICNQQTVVISCSLELITNKHTLQVPTKENSYFKEQNIKFQSHNEQAENITSTLLPLLGIKASYLNTRDKQNQLQEF